MKQVSLHIDAANLYTILKRKYSRKLDYSRLLEFCRSFGEIKDQVVYGRQLKREARGFITNLNSIGYKTIFRPYESLEAALTVGVMTCLKDSDIFIIGSNSRSLAPVTETLLTINKRVVLLGLQFPSEDNLPRTSAIELPPSVLENETTEINR